MNKTRILNWALAFFVFAFTLCLIELCFLLANRSAGVKLPYMYYRPIEATQEWAEVQAFDGILGYARSPSEKRIKDLALDSTHRDGFVYYNVPDTGDDIKIADLERPIIVTLGGSTVDAFEGENSWPEELAQTFIKDGIKGTIINGGVYGYSTSQELLKLIRDVTEIEPDICISYHGFNDYYFAPLPHPMTPLFFDRVFKGILDRGKANILFPNTFRYLKDRQVVDIKGLSEISYGYPTGKSEAEFFIRNVDLMNAISDKFGIEHINILQPFAHSGKYKEILAKDEYFYKTYIDDTDLRGVNMMFDEIKSQMDKTRTYDFTDTFDDVSESSPILFTDGCHVIREGNEIIAKRVYNLLKERGSI